MKVEIKLTLFVFSLLITSCYSGESAIATSTVKTQTESVATQDVCDWYLNAQPIRKKRIDGLNEFNQWFQAHNQNKLTKAESREYVEILVNYLPFLEEFVVDWKKLDSHPNPYAMVFWEKELNSVELKINSINKMDQGLKNNNLNLYNHGLDLFLQAQQTGLEAEVAQVEVHSQCSY